MNACAGLSRRRRVNLKKVNLESDASSREQDEASGPGAGVCPSGDPGVIPRAGKRRMFPDALLSRAADLVLVVTGGACRWNLS
jgi:hypothetical protein